jgi:uncharacterized protein YjeT (DUF2065 family)
VTDGVTFLLSVLGVVLMLEGLLPMISPSRWRHLFEQMVRLQDGQIRFFGMFSVILGLLLFWWAAL